jgi:hypothetical protein
MNTGVAKNNSSVSSRFRKSGGSPDSKPFFLKVSKFTENNFPVRVRRHKLPSIKLASKSPLPMALKGKEFSKAGANKNQLD